MKSEEHTGNRAPENGPDVGTDPQRTTQSGTHKATVHLDKRKVAEHDRDEHHPPRSPEEAAREIKNS
jgi:hypothetical protein